MPLPDSAAGRGSPLFPDIEPYANGWLAVDGLHELYWETCGNPRGVPVVFLHGGPGGGCLPHHRRFFVPRFWRIVLFDQRGAGRSTPPAELRDNATPHLVADLERLIPSGIARLTQQSAKASSGIPMSARGTGTT